MIYRVGFSDGSSFNGGENYEKTLWNSIPNKPIKLIAFTLPDKNRLILQGYNEYNSFIEATQEIYGGNKRTLRYQYLLGRLNDKVISYRVTLFSSKKDSRYQLGDITRREYEWGKEYKNSPTKGWKKGIIN